MVDESGGRGDARVMDRTPLVSIILCVRNGLPHLRDAVESIRSLSYPACELVVQDGASTDGSLEYLRSLEGLPRMSLVSATDTGIGQGFNRALQRCTGEVIGSVDADNVLRPDALDIVVRRFAEHPDAAVIYGACNMVDANGRFLHTWTPPEFDLLGLMEGAVVPPFATAFFSRQQCGAELSFDEEFRTVADFDLWLRLSHLTIVRVIDVLADVRVGEQSSTWNPDNYDDQSGYKIRALRKLLDGPAGRRVLETLYERAEAGIYLWAVDSMAVIGGGQDRIDRYFERAAKSDLRSERFRDVLARARPRLPSSDPTLGRRLLQCGIEYIEKCRPETALVYFEFLDAAGFEHPDLSRWLERGRKDRWEAQTQTEVAGYLQGEVNRRDRIIAEQSAWWSNEVSIRDQIIDRLRQQQEWMRSGWRRFVIRPPESTGEPRV
jgi:glycosyltransferase involved in cell wall biosynthesis